MNLQPPTVKKALRAVKTQIRLKKSEVHQCRLCLRIVSRELIRPTTADCIDLRRKIFEVVSVQISSEDKLNRVCVSCLLLVDIVYCFQVTCQQADTILRNRMVMMHPGSWVSDDNAEILEACHRLVKRSRAEMEALQNCSDIRIEPPSLEVVQQSPTEHHQHYVQTKMKEPVVWTTDISDGELKLNQAEQEAVEEEIRQQEVERMTNRMMCELCGKVFHRSALEQHKNRQHLQQRIYACPTEGCSSKFFSKRGKAAHVLRMHSGIVQQYECETCHRQLKGKHSYEKHLKTHDDDTENPSKEPCSVCGKLFYKRYIKDHMAVHTGELRYSCEFCDRKFAAKTNWHVHRKKQHLDKM